jgi:hypothetical protein
MAMVLPDDIAERMAAFLAGRTGFPFIGKDELMCLMYLYGRTGGIKDSGEAAEAAELAQRTAGQMAVDVESYGMPGRLDPEFIKSRYLNRELQLAIDSSSAKGQRRPSLGTDPAAVADCFAQHVAYYKQDYFFGLYGPLKEGELTADIRPALTGRMVMVCYNRKGESELGTPHPLIPVYVWFKQK